MLPRVLLCSGIGFVLCNAIVLAIGARGPATIPLIVVGGIMAIAGFAWLMITERQRPPD